MASRRYQLMNFCDAYLGKVRSGAIPSTFPMTNFVGLSDRVKFTSGATIVAIVPMASVLASIMSRSFGRPWVYFMRAAWIMSPILTFEGQATSQRLQLRQYLRASLKKTGSFRR